MAEASPHQDDDRWEDASDVFDVISEADSEFRRVGTRVREARIQGP